MKVSVTVIIKINEEGSNIESQTELKKLGQYIIIIRWFLEPKENEEDNIFNCVSEFDDFISYICNTRQNTLDKNTTYIRKTSSKK